MASVDRSVAADLRQRGAWRVTGTLNWLARNGPLMVLSIILALLAWVVAANEADPVRTTAFPQPIPVEVAGLADDVTLVDNFDGEVEVTVRALESAWNELATENFTAQADLSSLAPGVYQVPVEVSVDVPNAAIVDFQPEYFKLQLDQRAERRMPVDVRLEGEPELGYLTHQVSISPTQVTMVGPRSYVNQVTTVAAAISVEGVSEDVSASSALSALDDQGEPVPYVRLRPAEAQIDVTISLSGNYRTLTIVPVKRGEVAPGYRITYITVDPPAITVRGARSVISALPAYIEATIDVEGAQDDMTLYPVIDVPSNVAVVSGQQVEVRVFVEPIESSVTVGPITPTIQGLEPGFTATLSPASVEVILGGPMPLLDTLTEDNVRVVVDLFDLTEGTHQVSPEVIAPEGARVQNVLPEVVEVEISAAPTPTGTVSPLPTATPETEIIAQEP